MKLSGTVDVSKITCSSVKLTGPTTLEGVVIETGMLLGQYERCEVIIAGASKLACSAVNCDMVLREGSHASVSGSQNGIIKNQGGNISVNQAKNAHIVQESGNTVVAESSGVSFESSGGSLVVERGVQFAILQLEHTNVDAAAAVTLTAANMKLIGTENEFNEDVVLTAEILACDPEFAVVKGMQLKNVIKVACPLLSLSGGSVISDEGTSHFEDTVVSWEDDSSVLSGNFSANRSRIVVNSGSTFTIGPLVRLASGWALEVQGTLVASAAATAVDVLQLVPLSRCVLQQGASLTTGMLSGTDSTVALNGGSLNVFGTSCTIERVKFEGTGKFLVRAGTFSCAEECTFQSDVSVSITASIVGTVMNCGSLCLSAASVDATSAISATLLSVDENVVNSGTIACLQELQANNTAISGAGQLKLTGATVTGMLLNTDNIITTAGSVVVAAETFHARGVVVPEDAILEVSQNTLDASVGSLTLGSGATLQIDGTIEVSDVSLGSGSFLKGSGKLTLKNGSVSGRCEGDLSVLVKGGDLTFADYENSAVVEISGSVVRGGIVNKRRLTIAESRMVSCAITNGKRMRVEGSIEGISASIVSLSSSTVQFSDVALDFDEKSSCDFAGTTQLVGSAQQCINSAVNVSGGKLIVRADTKFTGALTLDAVSVELFSRMLFSRLKLTDTAITATGSSALGTSGEQPYLEGINSSISARLRPESTLQVLGDKLSIENLETLSALTLRGTVVLGSLVATPKTSGQSAAVFTDGVFEIQNRLELRGKTSFQGASVLTGESCTVLLDACTFATSGSATLPWTNRGTVLVKSSTSGQRVLKNESTVTVSAGSVLDGTVSNYGVLLVTNATLVDIESSAGTVQYTGDCTIDRSSISDSRLSCRDAGRLSLLGSRFSSTTLSAAHVECEACSFAEATVLASSLQCSSCEGAVSISAAETSIRNSAFTELHYLPKDRSAHLLVSSTVAKCAVDAAVSARVEVKDIKLSGTFEIHEGVALDVTGKMTDIGEAALLLNDNGHAHFAAGFTEGVPYRQCGALSFSHPDPESSVYQCTIDAGVSFLEGDIHKTSVHVGTDGTLTFQDAIPSPANVSTLFLELDAGSCTKFSIFGTDAFDHVTTKAFKHTQDARLSFAFMDGFVPRVGDAFTVVEFRTPLSSPEAAFSLVSSGVDPRALEVRYSPDDGKNVTLYVVGCPGGLLLDTHGDCVSPLVPKEVVVPKWPPFVFSLFIGLLILLFFVKKNRYDSEMPKLVAKMFGEAVSPAPDMVSAQQEEMVTDKKTLAFFKVFTPKLCCDGKDHAGKCTELCSVSSDPDNTKNECLCSPTENGLTPAVVSAKMTEDGDIHSPQRQEGDDNVTSRKDDAKTINESGEAGKALCGAEAENEGKKESSVQSTSVLCEHANEGYSNSSSGTKEPDNTETVIFGNDKPQQQNDENALEGKDRGAYARMPVFQGIGTQLSDLLKAGSQSRAFKFLKNEFYQCYESLQKKTVELGREKKEESPDDVLIKTLTDSLSCLVEKMKEENERLEEELKRSMYRDKNIELLDAIHGGSRVQEILLSGLVKRFIPLPSAEKTSGYAFH